MKKIVTIILELIFILGLSGCGSKDDSEKIFLPDNIEKITIAWNGCSLTTFSYTDDEKIAKLVGYLTSLELSSTKKDPTQYNGGGWVITVILDSEILEMHHYGNLFFKTSDEKWWEIPYEQATEFEALLKENIPDELPQNSIFDEWIK